MSRLLAWLFADETPPVRRTAPLSLQSLGERLAPAVLSPTPPLTSTAVQVCVTTPKPAPVAVATPARTVVTTPVAVAAPTKAVATAPVAVAAPTKATPTATTLTVQPQNVKDVIQELNPQIVAGQGKIDSILNASQEVMSGSSWLREYVGCVADFIAVGAGVGGTVGGGAGYVAGGPAGGAAGAASGGAVGGAIGLSFGLGYCAGEESDSTASDTSSSGSTTSPDSTDGSDGSGGNSGSDTEEKNTCEPDDELPNPDDYYGTVARGSVTVTSGQLAAATKLSSPAVAVTNTLVGAAVPQIGTTVVKGK